MSNDLIYIIKFPTPKDLLQKFEIKSVRDCVKTYNKQDNKNILYHEFNKSYDYTKYNELNLNKSIAKINSILLNKNNTKFITNIKFNKNLININMVKLIDLVIDDLLHNPKTEIELRFRGLGYNDIHNNKTILTNIICFEFVLPKIMFE